MSDAIEKRKKKEKKVEAREERDFRAHMKCTSDGRGEKTSVTFIYFLERKVSQMLPAVDFIRHESFSVSLYFYFFLSLHCKPLHFNPIHLPSFSLAKYKLILPE